MNDDMVRHGFTLIELLIVIAIIAVLIAFVVANFVGARQRAHDIQKKSELQQVKNALRMYYNDYARYPLPVTEVTNTVYGCGSGTPPTDDCADVCEGRFEVGGDEACDGGTVYMKLLPPATDYAWSYAQRSSGDDFCLWTTLDNVSDSEVAKSQTRCASVCNTLVPSTAYVLCAD